MSNNTSFNEPKEDHAVAADDNGQHGNAATTVDHEDTVVIALHRIPLVNAERRHPISVSNAYRTPAQAPARMPTFGRPQESQRVRLTAGFQHAAGDDGFMSFYGLNMDMGLFAANTLVSRGRKVSRIFAHRIPKQTAQPNLDTGVMQSAQTQNVQSVDAVVQRDEPDVTDDMEVQDGLDVEDDEHNDV
ncbi:unnamed protein product [Peniophora sp. CBMAI 1063]|nr:unnamed protein product [Peniophora sp. CBMAI 1063]